MIWLIAGCAEPADPIDPVDPQEPEQEEEVEEEEEEVPTLDIVPSEVFPGRTLDLVIHGEGTAWTDAVVVAFGPDLVPGAVTVTSPTEIHATVIVPWDATFGVREVTVTHGDDAPLGSSIEVVPSLAFTQLYGATAQGSLLYVGVENLDTEPFDLSLVEGGAQIYADLEVATAPGIAAEYGPCCGGDTPFHMFVGFELDVDAITGPFEVQVRSGPEKRLFRSEAIDIAPRSPVPLEEGVAVAGNLPAFADTLLYSLGSERSIFELSSVAVGNSPDTQIMLLGPSGSFGEMVGWADRRVGATSDGPVYAVVTATGGFAMNVDFTVVGRSAPLGTAFVSETASPNDTWEAAQAVELPITVEDGEIETLPEGGNGEDWYRIAIGPDDADRSLAISTFDPNDAESDTRVRLVSDDGVVLVDQDSPTIGWNYHETVFSPPLAEGTFYVVISWSEGSASYSWPATYGLALALAAP